MSLCSPTAPTPVSLHCDEIVCKKKTKKKKCGESFASAELESLAFLRKKSSVRKATQTKKIDGSFVLHSSLFPTDDVRAERSSQDFAFVRIGRARVRIHRETMAPKGTGRILSAALRTGDMSHVRAVLKKEKIPNAQYHEFLIWLVKNIDDVAMKESALPPEVVQNLALAVFMEDVVEFVVARGKLTHRDGETLTRRAVHLIDQLRGLVCHGNVSKEREPALWEVAQKKTVELEACVRNMASLM